MSLHGNCFVRALTVDVSVQNQYASLFQCMKLICITGCCSIGFFHSWTQSLPDFGLIYHLPECIILDTSSTWAGIWLCKCCDTWAIYCKSWTVLWLYLSVSVQWTSKHCISVSLQHTHRHTHTPPPPMLCILAAQLSISWWIVIS